MIILIIYLFLFENKMEDSVFQTVVDRLATSSDFSSVREGILIFLQTHLKTFPGGFNNEVKQIRIMSIHI